MKSFGLRHVPRAASLRQPPEFRSRPCQATTINKPLPGGQAIRYYRWWDQYYFAQDEWKLHPTLTLNLGLRYELPGSNISRLVEQNERVLAANGNDAVFRLTPVPKADRNNLEPRVGFNWVPRTSDTGIVGLLTGGDLCRCAEGTRARTITRS